MDRDMSEQEQQREMEWAAEREADWDALDDVVAGIVHADPAVQEALRQDAEQQIEAKWGEQVGRPAQHQPDGTLRHSVEIGPVTNAGFGPVVIDGLDVSAQVRTVELSIEAGRPVRLQLGVMPRRLGVRADGAEVALDEMTETLLRRLGWREPGSEGVPLNEMRTGADHRAEVLARWVEQYVDTDVNDRDHLWDGVERALTSWQEAVDRPGGADLYPRAEAPQQGEPAPELGFRRISGLWQHGECGALMQSDERPGPHACAVCDHAPSDIWHKVYVGPTRVQPSGITFDESAVEEGRQRSRLELVAERAAEVLRAALEDPSNGRRGLAAFNAMAGALVAAGMLTEGEAREIDEIGGELAAYLENTAGEGGHDGADEATG